ncbi:hypothetical protein PR202_gb12060 [Eleusine coracana subsp. coracana]|uniref:Uncharacterized protein n=1 Tax=Eleusine coracana subsp. coracana TaxID=191504 RepID=A0AAV5EM17_ELECO|nr:hypothetical protein PR202_gb12060 [Eleusine coracana subsp. coracana]
MTQVLVLGIVLVVRLVPERVKRIIAPMYGISQHVQLEEHGMVCDNPPHGLISYDLRPEESSLQVVLHMEHRWLGDFADYEIYGFSGQLTKDCGKEKMHFQQVEVRVNRSV